MTPLNFLTIQHIDWETPGKLLLDASKRLNINLDVIKIYKEAAPDPADYDALLLLGGPANVDEDEQYPFLKEEKRLIKAWLAMDRPCLGFCLGHQLLADGLGAEIVDNLMPSIGFTQGHLTSVGRGHPIFKGIDSPLPLFKWHGQAIGTPLPREIIMLATSSQCVIEAFSVAGRPHIVGFQCDNHAAHPDDVRSWLEHDRAWIGNLPQYESLLMLPRQAKEKQKETEFFIFKIMSNFKKIIQAGTHLSINQ